MTNTLPKPLMLAVALIQGVFLFLLYRAVEDNYWPNTHPVWLLTCLAFVIAVPSFFLLLVNQQNLHKALICLAPFSLGLIGVSAYSGLQFMPQEYLRNQIIIAPFIFTISIAAFKALMYAQEYSAETNLTYHSLFHRSWRNFLVLGLSLLFTLLFFGILLLWGLLFDVINISFFMELFRQEWFFFPAGSLAFAFAIIIFRSLSKVIDSISALLKALIKFLLPLLAVVSITFMLALLLKGFTLLWETNLGSGLILWLQALLLFSVNAVYQGDSEERPYPILVHRLIYLGIAILPIYSITALYGLLTRITQYGLTVQRCWAVLVALILFFFALGYLWGIISKKDHWLESLAWVNVRMGVFIMGMMLLVNSPIASFQKLSTQNQISRLQAGIIEPEELDINYFRFSLGRQGYLALQTVKEEYGEEYPRLAEHIDASYRNEVFTIPSTVTLTSIEEALSIWPEGRTVPEPVLQGMLGQGTSYSPIGGFRTVATSADGIANAVAVPALSPIPIYSNSEESDRFYAIFIEMNNTDLNNDNAEEIIFIRETLAGFRYFYLWTFQDNEWQATFLNSIGASPDIDLPSIFAQDQINTVPSQWNDVQIGGLRLSVPERRNRL